MSSRKTTWILPAVLGFAAAFVVGAAAQTMTGGDASPWDWMTGDGMQSGYGMNGGGMGGHGGQSGSGHMGGQGHHGSCDGSAPNGTAGNGTYCDGSGPHGSGDGSCTQDPGAEPQRSRLRTRLSTPFDITE